MDKQKILWSNDLSVNNLMIDKQHQHLFDLINELSSESVRTELKEYVRLLSCLKNYFMIHFSDEEAYMQRYDYPDLEMHKVEHEKFIYRFSMFDIVNISSIPIGTDIIQLFTQYWLFLHVMKFDLQYRDYIIKKNEHYER